MKHSKITKNNTENRHRVEMRELVGIDKARIKVELTPLKEIKTYKDYLNEKTIY